MDRTSNSSNFPIIYGFPLDEQEHDFIPPQASAEYVLPSASAYQATGAEFLENVNASIIPLMDSNELFDFIEIFAEDEEIYESAVEVAVTASPVAMPIASVQQSEVCSVYPFAVSEAHYYEPYSLDSIEEEKKEIEFLSDDCVKAYPSQFLEEEKQKVESYEQPIGAPIAEVLDSSNQEYPSKQFDLSQSHSSEWKIKRRQEAIARWRLKKQKRKNAEKSKVILDVRPSSLNARQQAASKRVRENGKFKRNQIKWVAASDVF